MKRVKQWFILKWDWLVEKYYAWKLKRMNKKNKNKDPFLYKQYGRKDNNNEE